MSNRAGMRGFGQSQGTATPQAPITPDAGGQPPMARYARPQRFPLDGAPMGGQGFVQSLMQQIMGRRG